jgi:hypothetical protein
MEQEYLWYNILIQSNLDDLQYNCMTNTITKFICYNKNFWFNKAALYGVPPQFFNLPHTPADWIRLIKIHKQSDILLQAMLREFKMCCLHTF